MALKAFHRRSTQPALQPPTPTGHADNAGSSTTASPQLRIATRAPSSIGARHVKSRPLVVSQSDSLRVSSPMQREAPVPSGMQIRRRPPSLQGRTPSPLIARPAVASLKREIVEHRMDPSPAPSRPPRGVKRQSALSFPSMLSLHSGNPSPGLTEFRQPKPRATSALQSASDKRKSPAIRRPSRDSKKSSVGNGALIPPPPPTQKLHSPSAVAHGSLRRGFLQDAKLSSRARSGLGQKIEVIQGQDKGSCEEVLHRYRTLCEAIGHIPNKAWILAILRGTDGRPPTCSRVGSSVVHAADSKLHLVNSNTTLAPSKGSGVSEAKEKMGSGLHSKLRTQSAGNARRSSTASKPLDTASSKSSALPSSTGVSRECLESNALLEHMVKYCQQLQLYSEKMEMLRKRRIGVHDALERFLALLRGCQHQPGNGGSKLSTMTNLESHANLLTDGMRELQRCNVELLQALASCSHEVRRPLGVAGSGLELGPAEQLSESTESGSASPLAISLPSNCAGATPLSLPSLVEPPMGYLKFLRTEERCIVEELNDVCLRVRGALDKASNVSVADNAMLDTPIFVPSFSSSLAPAVGGETASLHPVGEDGERKQQASSAARRFFPQSSLAGFSGGNSGAFLSHACCTGGGCGHVAQGLGSGKTADNSVENGGRIRLQGIDSCSTIGSERVDMENSQLCTPFVGVALTGWGVSHEDKESGVGGVGGGDNCRNFRRYSTSNPQLVLGGGQRCFSLCSPATKRPGSSDSNPHVGSRNSASKPVKAKMTTTGSATKATTIMKGQKCKVTRMPSSFSGCRNTITPTQIGEAVEAWSVISGLAMAFVKDDASSDGQREDRGYVDGEKYGGCCGQANVTCNDKSDKKLHPIGTAPTLKSVLSRGVKTGNDVKPQRPRLGAVGSELTSEEHWPRSSPPSATGPCPRIKAKMEAATLITRFLRFWMWRKRCLAGEREERRCQDGATLVSRLRQNGEFPQPLRVREAMAVRIACCWRQCVARRIVQQRRTQALVAKKEYQKWDYDNLMAHRLQRFLASIVVRRKQRESTRRNPHTSDVAPKNSDTTASGSARGTQKNGHALTTRERFDRAREKRRLLLHSHLEGKKSSAMVEEDILLSHPVSAIPRKEEEQQQQLQQQQQQKKKGIEVAAAIPIPPLNLESSHISTFFIDKYNPEEESFEVEVLHRLLRAPKALLYTLCIMCNSCETRPDSALAALSANERAASRAENQTKEKKQLQDDDKVRGAVAAGGATSFVESSRVAEDKQNIAGVSCRQRGNESGEVKLEIMPYLKLQCHLLARNFPLTNASGMVLGCLLSIRADNVVEEDELRVEVPTQRPFRRPFEEWGIAYDFQRRTFTAAAVYAWKLIFSRTPHDDYKQRMLKTEEEREARLERVEQRNRMILACYCVRSEREWLKEASRDLGFVSRIWNPKRSLDPNDPDFERHCRETYEFVEDFLYQCFPSVASLDDVPAFLMGAGIFFVLSSALASLPAEVVIADKSDKQPHGTLMALNSTMKPMHAQQRHVLFAQELLNLVDTLSHCLCPVQREKSSEKLCPDDTTNSNNNNHNNNDNNVNSNGSSFLDMWEWQFERTVRSLAGTMYSSTRVPTLFAASVNVGDAAQADVNRPHVQIWQAPSSSSSAVAKQLVLVYPRGHLLKLSERLARALLGVDLDLEVCEDLDAMS